MAEAVLFNLATDILKLAGSITSSKIQLVRGVSDELNGLKHTVETIQAVLLDAEKKQWDSEQVKHWLRRLKDVLYEAQDLLDDVATKDLRRKVTPPNKTWKAVRVFFSKSNQLAQPYRVAKKIQEIRKTLDCIANDKKFHLEYHPNEATVTTVRRRTTDSFVRKEEIIGRQIDERKIIESLLDSSSKESVSVVSIVGMGGLGKTTLARLVYNDDKVGNYFKLKMWVYVSDVFDEDLLIKDILKSSQDECRGDPEMERNLQDIENKSKDQLQRVLRKVLDGKKYLLVLDDLWNEDRQRWSELRGLLMGGSWGSKILVTTRNKSVVQATDANSVIHELDVLSKGESWDLLKKTAFRDGEESLNQKLEEIGQDIVKKCGGVPLAIKTIGNLLYAKKENEWLHFKEHESSKIDTLNPGIMDVLKISYSHLQPILKQCFAYCALFPKGYVFDKITMIQYWMAQGFIESENEKFEEIGDSYVSDLLCKSFFEVEEVDSYTGEVKMFKMHDLMHDLALTVSGNECISLNTGNINEHTRHVSFASESSLSLQEVTSLLEATNVRTFLSLKRRPFVKKSSNGCHGIFSKFRHCRTLVLDHADFSMPPSLGSELTHLRLLDVSDNQSIESLPDSITDLLNLQTLKLTRCENLKTLPGDWRKLINLRYLSIDQCCSLSHLPPLSELLSLRTLSLEFLDVLEFLQQTSDPKQSNSTCPFFPSLEILILYDCYHLKGWWGRRQLVGKYQNHQLGSSKSFFPKLRHVDISGCPKLNSVPPFPQVEYLTIDSMKILKQQLMVKLICPSEAAVESTFIPFFKLERLQLSGQHLELSIFETLLLSASNLKAMHLHNCDLSTVSRGMQHLPSLQVLDIIACKGLDLSCQEDKQGTQWQFLTELHVLKISYLSDLVALPEWIQHATTLQSLEISHCRNLRSLPEWIENFPLLKNLVFSDCPSLKPLPSDRHNLTHLENPRLSISRREVPNGCARCGHRLGG